MMSSSRTIQDKSAVNFFESPIEVTLIDFNPSKRFALSGKSYFIKVESSFIILTFAISNPMIFRKMQ